MKLNDLKKAAAKAKTLQDAEHKVAELQRNAKAARAKAEQARLAYKSVRKTAKQAKKLASTAEEQGRERCRVWEKAQKRLAKALKKLAKAKGGETKKAAQAGTATGKAKLPKPAAKKQPPVPQTTPKPAATRQSSPSSAGAVAPTPASPLS